MSIREYKSYKAMAISRDMNVADEEQVYIGNGQGCGTFWFRNLEEARKFIGVYRKRMVVDKNGGVRGLIPEHICCSCQCRYSHGTKEWRKFPAYACKNKKQALKDIAVNM